MLGGIDITDQALSHAREMLGKAGPADVKKKKRSR
jgi:hypothetical protein